MSSKWMYPVYGAVRSAVSLMFYLNKQLKRLMGKPRLLIFTDSRGFRVDIWYCKKNPLRSYIARFARNYAVDYFICMYPHTTLIDFLYDTRNIDLISYDFIILHAGVVDFSPRPRKQAESIIRKKASRIREVFGEQAVSEFVPFQYNELYNGQPTASLYSISMLNKYILPRMNSYGKKLVWIGVNEVLVDWQGSYSRPRPENLNVILSYQDSIDTRFSGSRVDLRSWKDDSIRRYTVDNIHLSDQGIRYLENELSQILLKQR